MNTYWKIHFDDGKEGFGWVQFNEQMESTGLFDLIGNEVKTAVGYTPIEFGARPDWDK